MKPLKKKTMAETNEDPAKSLKEEIEKRKEDVKSNKCGQKEIKDKKIHTPIETGKGKCQIEDGEFVQKSHVEDKFQKQSQLKGKDHEEEVIIDSSEEKSEFGLPLSIVRKEMSLEMHFKMMLDRKRKTPPKKAWSLDKDESRLAKNVTIDGEFEQESHGEGEGQKQCQLEDENHEEEIRNEEKDNFGLPISKDNKEKKLEMFFKRMLDRKRKSPTKSLHNEQSILAKKVRIDGDFVQESHFEDKCQKQCQLEDEDHEAEVSNEEKNELGMSISKEHNEKDVEPLHKMMLDRKRKVPPKKAWNFYKEQSVLAKKVEVDSGKTVCNNEYNETFQQNISVVKMNESLGMNKEECAKSRAEKNICGQIKDKNVRTPSCEWENSIESPKTKSIGFSNTNTLSEHSASKKIVLSDNNENENEECEEKDDCEKPEEKGSKGKDDSEKTEKEGSKGKDDYEKPEEKGSNGKDDGEKTEKEGSKGKDDGEKTEKEGSKGKDDGKKTEEGSKGKDGGKKTEEEGSKGKDGGEKTEEEECKGKNDSEKTEEEESEEKDDCDKTEEEEDNSEDSPSPLRRRETETETDDTDKEDFSTEGLLKELHFLNASCEKPLVKKIATLQIHRTPKKQRKLEFDSLSHDPSIPAKTAGKKTSVRKKIRSSTASPDKPCLWKIDRGVGKMEPCYTSPHKLKKSLTKENDSTRQSHMDTSNDESDEDEGSLTIVAQEEKPKKRKGMVTPAKSKKRIRAVDSGDVPQEVIELIQSGIDEVLEEKAERTHLTAIHVKNIIKNVMTDDNVLTMVRNTVLSIHGSGTEAPAVYEPTLTRAKTKELMEQQAAGVGNGNIWAGLSNSKAGGSSTLNPETQALATTDFPDEDEDEEYTPEADEHLHSDDESLVSTGFGSEIGSPSTPCTPSSSYMSSTPGSYQSLNTPLSSSLSTPANQRLMVVRIPEMQRKTVQRILNFEKVPKREEVVSQRTRSKLPLTETPLECLEMAFKPPDVTNDMYETEVDNDDWKSFLIDFIHPLKSTEVVEDEEADPEYNILEDKEDALDLREEMRGDRAVQISKKEMNELMTELLDTLGNNEETEPVRMHLSQHISQKEAKKPQFKMPQTCQSINDKEGGPSSGAIWVEILTAEFTKTQLKILQCQMIQHVQLLTTSSVMCFGVPHLDYVTDGCFKSLEELKKNADASDFRNTFFRPFSLQPAIETLKIFKSKSSNILPNDMQLKCYAAELHPLVMEKVLESSAFPYPRLLPTRMFQHPNTRGFRKTTFVLTEDMLIAIGLERYLDPKYRSAKCKKSQYRLLLEALALTVENVLVAKTLSQATNRVKNIRCRAKDAPNNPVLQFLETGQMDLPQAEVEPLLPCVPCPVQNFPEVSLEDPYRRVVQMCNAAQRYTLIAAARAAAKKAALADENEKRETKFRGAGISQKSIQNIVIIQASCGSKQLLVSPDVVKPVMSCSCLVDKCVIQKPSAVSLPGKQVVMMTDPQSHRCCAKVGGSSQSGSFPTCSLYTPAGDHTQDSLNTQTNARAVISNNTENTLMANLASDPGSHLLSHNVEVIGEVSVDSSRVILSEGTASSGDDATEIQSPSVLKTSELECEPMNEEVELNRIDNVMNNSTRLNTNVDQGNEHNESHDRMRMDNVRQNQETVHKNNSNCDSVSENEYLPNLTMEPKESETDSENKNNNENQSIDTSLEKKSQSVLSVDFVGELNILPETPEKIHPTTLSSIPTPYIHVGSCLTTPCKSDERDAETVCLSTSPLGTPVISAPSPGKSLNTPVKAMSEIKRTNLSSVLESNMEPVVPCTSVAPVLPSNKDCLLESSIPVRSLEVDKEKGINKGKENRNVDKFRNTDIYKPKSSEKNCMVVRKTQLLNQDKTHEKLSTQVSTVAQNQVTTQSSSVTLVTSVYQSPIFSSGVGKSNSLNILNIAPQKTKTPLRRISPAKGFRSPMKASPLKQVSPILRKYHKYSPKKRRLMSSNKKLSPILPKISHRSSPGQRRLAPKPSKSSSALEDVIRVRGSNNRRTTGSESFLHSTKHVADGDLLQMDDVLMDSNVSASPTCKPVTKIHQSEEDFEEDYLEDEDEEDEDEEDEDEEEEEEEDLEAVQQREEHLAALLKASSTITFRRGGGGDGFEKKLNGVGDLGQGERRLTKQQRRLQARITALSYVPDTITQDKFVAQSYLMRVREALMGKNPAAFKEFLYLLTEFTENRKNSPLELYSQLCEVLKEFPHLTEEFVSFLLPKQAMAIGKYAQYCVIHRMRDFLEKLELQFSKQPQIIQKIIRLLQSMQSRSDLNIEEVKAAMTPLLKYPHLVECFTQCFPSQPPAPSLQSDFEDISLDHPGTPDSMESLILPEDESNTSPNRCVCSCHASDSSSPSNIAGSHHNPASTGRTDHCLSCALRFSEGRVFLQCGKTLRPARVTYQAVDLKKEECDDKNTQGSAVGGNVVTECGETSTKGKNAGKGKLSQTKDSSENVHVRTKESVNKALPSSSANSTTTHANNNSVLKSRTMAASEEKCVRDDTGNQTEKKDAKCRGDDGACAAEPVVSRNLESIHSKSDNNSDGKSHHVKKMWLNRGFERTEGPTHVDTICAKSTSQNKSCSFQNNVNPVKGKASGLIAENSSRSLRNKESHLLPCSPPKEIHNENAVLPSCSNTSSICDFSTIGELLAQHGSVIDERTKPSASAVIVTDKFELQKEHKATLCHLPPRIPQNKTTKTLPTTNSKTTSNKALSVHSAGNGQNLCSIPKTSFSNCISLRDSKTSSESVLCASSTSSVKTSAASGYITSSTSISSSTETKKPVRDVSEDLGLSSKPSLSSASVLTIPVTSASNTSFNSVTWTKDEDRMILTLVQQKGATDAVFQEIADALPLRDYSEVFDRFNMLVKLMMEDTDFEDSMSISSEDSTI